MVLAALPLRILQSQTSRSIFKVFRQVAAGFWTKTEFQAQIPLHSQPHVELRSHLAAGLLALRPARLRLEVCGLRIPIQSQRNSVTPKERHFTAERSRRL